MCGRPPASRSLGGLVLLLRNTSVRLITFCGSTVYMWLTSKHLLTTSLFPLFPVSPLLSPPSSCLPPSSFPSFSFSFFFVFFFFPSMEIGAGPVCSGHAPYYLAIFPPIMLEFTFKNVLKSNSTLTVYLGCVGRMVPESSLASFFLVIPCIQYIWKNSCVRRRVLNSVTFYSPLLQLNWLYALAFKMMFLHQAWSLSTHPPSLSESSSAHGPYAALLFHPV